ERGTEAAVRPRARQGLAHASQSLIGRDTEPLTEVRRGDRGSATFGSDAMEQHRASFVSILRDRRGDVAEDELEVGVVLGIGVVDQPYLKVLCAFAHIERAGSTEGYDDVGVVVVDGGRVTEAHAW